ncbi:MAG: hypothetical protein RBG13Loki_2811 [Promethearchaeota archaeon CR_4]|nr:MAG: hypothetical protein RBG13Loki_2811 [Candidatus Lokiarchaeota archaeon CR_4]
MRWILDANSLIYLTRAGLTQKFVDLADFQTVIDKEVYHEVVERGKDRNKPDSDQADQYLKTNNIPIIPVNIDRVIGHFKDPGEASCFVLAKSEGVCVTNDIRAIKKFRAQQVDAMPFEIFFGRRYREGRLPGAEFERILEELVKANALTQERKIFTLKKNQDVLRGIRNE